MGKIKKTAFLATMIVSVYGLTVVPAYSDTPLRTKEIRVEIFDNNFPGTSVKSFNGTKMTVSAAKKKAGRLTKSRSLAVVCVGDFRNGFGYIADDLYRGGDELNSSFKISPKSTLMDVCRQQELRYRGP